MQPKSEECPCGAHKHKDRIVCSDCWSTAPADLRVVFYAGGKGSKKEAIEGLRKHAHARGAARNSRMASVQATLSGR